MHLNDIGDESIITSLAKGFSTITPKDWPIGPHPGKNPERIPTKLALIHSEVSEALEEFRKKHRLDAFGFELADVVIRTAQLARGLGIDLDAATEKKLKKNRRRGIRHGGKLI